MRLGTVYINIENKKSNTRFKIHLTALDINSFRKLCAALVK